MLVSTSQPFCCTNAPVQGGMEEVGSHSATSFHKGVPSCPYGFRPASALTENGVGV